MTTHTEIVREVAEFGDLEPRNDWQCFLRDTNRVTGTFTSSTSAVLRETAAIVEHASPQGYALLRETGALGDALTAGVDVSRVMRDVARLNDHVFGSAVSVVTVRDVAVLDDAATPGAAFTVARDSAVIDDAVTYNSTITRVLRETARIADRLGNVAGLSVRESAVLNDNATGVGRGREVVRDTALLADDVSALHTHIAVVREVAGLSDALSVTTAVMAGLRDRAWIEGRAVLPWAGRAFTANVTNFGMSQYADFPFTDIAGDLAVAADGAHRLSVAPGVGGYFTTGFLDLATSHDKRVAYVYSAGVSENGVIVTVTADRWRMREAYEYTQESISTDYTRNSRVQVGKGLCGRYWQFKYTADAPMRIKQLTLDATRTMRRL